MSTTSTLAVTGATGVLGGMVARDLAARGIVQRLLVRTPARAPQLPNTTVHQMSYNDQTAVYDALIGVEILFMVSASESADRLDQHRTFVDAAAAAGVQHVVYTSFAAAAPDATFTLARDHYFTEEHIKASGMAWTFLRDSFYIDFMEALVGDDDVIRGPAGDGRCAIVARTDVARTAATVLSNPGHHRSRTYDLTGPGGAQSRRGRRTSSSRVRRSNRHLRERDDQPGLRLPGSLRRTRLATRCLGQHLHRHRQRHPAPTSDAIHAITGTAPRSLEEHLLQTRRVQISN